MSETIRTRLRAVVRTLSGRTLAFLLVGTMTILTYAYYITSLNLFVIRDGDKLTIHETYTRNAEDALREAGITISKYDSVSLPAEPLRGGAAEVVIQRSHIVTVLYDGKEIRMSTYDGDVSSVLERAGVTLGNLDVVTPDIDTMTTDGMTVEVKRRDIRTEQIVEAVPFERLSEESSKRRVGYESVRQKGSEGERSIFYEILLEEGVEISRRETANVVTIDPVPEITVIGTAAPETTSAPKEPVVRLEEASAGVLKMPDGTEVAYSRMLEVKATAYSTEGQSNKKNALGKIARVGTIAVDPKVIPLRSRVYVESPDGSWVYGIAVCEDTGGSIKGNKIDLYFDTRSECFSFGVRKAKIYVLE